MTLIDQLIASSRPSYPSPTSSNGPLLCLFWEQVLHASLTTGPVTDINTSFPVPAEGTDPASQSSESSKTKKGKRHLRNERAQGKRPKLAKVDILAEAGRNWTRLLTIKRNSLLADFRESESYLVEDSDDEAASQESDDGTEGAQQPLASSGVSEGRAKRLGRANALFAQLDQTTANCSIVRTLEELLACRAASPEGDDLVIELIFTRLELPNPSPEAGRSLSLSRDFLITASEQERYYRRLQCISDLLASLPNVIVRIASQLLKAPTGQLLPSELSTARDLPGLPDQAQADRLALPSIPVPPKEANLQSTAFTVDINLDVSALVALVSDISHMPLPEEATSEDDLQALFHAGGLKSLFGDKSAPSVLVDEAGEGVDEDEGEEEEEDEEPSSEIRSDSPAGNSRRHRHRRGRGNGNKSGSSKARYLHGRALALQLGLEKQGHSFLSYLITESRRLGQSLRLHTTKEAKAKFDEIMRMVAGQTEQRRGRALFNESVAGDGSIVEEAFWQGSRWAGKQEVREAFMLPIQLFPAEAGRDEQTLSTGDTDQTFPQRMRQILLDALHDLENEAHNATPQAKTAVLTSNSRQTTHTLRTLLIGLDRKMTTLTTNMLSVKWLVKEAGRRLSTSRGDDTLTQHSTSKEEERVIAAIWVTNPRSLAERMRKTTPIDSHLVQPNSTEGTSSSEAATVDGLSSTLYSSTISDPSSNAKNMDPLQSREVASSDHPSLSSSTGSGSLDKSIAIAGLAGGTAGVAVSTHHRRPYERQGSSLSYDNKKAFATSKDVGQLYRGESSYSSSPTTQVVHELSKDGASNGSGSGSAKETASSMRASYPPTPHQADRATSADAPEGTRAIDHHVAPPSSRLRRSLRWIGGPRPPAKLEIKHYKWWPLAGVEATWLRWTTPIRYRDPRELGQLAVDDDAIATSTGTAWSRRKRPAWLRRGLGSQLNDVEELPASATSSSPTAIARYGDDEDDIHPTTAWKRSWSSEYRTNRLHWLLLFLTYIAWIFAFVFIAQDIWFDASVVSPSTGESSQASFLGCTSTYWLGNDGCGLDGQDCEPFYSNTSSAFRCPAGCSGTVLGAARAIGSELPNFVPLIVGGGDELGMYRGDSWICAAAVHAGVIDDNIGGCGQLWLAGAYSNYTASEAHGLQSYSFDSSFPISYFFQRDTIDSKCSDRRSQLYILDSIMSALVGLVLQPKLLVFFWTLACLGFWHVNYASEPRSFPPTVGDPMGDFLPALFICYGLWRLVFRYLWPAFDHAPLERGISILGLWWLGTLLDVVFANVPLQRLVLSDIQQQPGALTSLIVIVVVVVVVAINQVRVIRKTGYLPKYLSWTIVAAIIIGLLSAVPTTGLRLHHYVIALCLLPYCSFQTRISLLGSAFLLGMFINGGARWGFDGIIQDVADIVGDGTSGSLTPSFTTTASNWTGVDPTNSSATGLVSWASIPDGSGYDGFSLIVDDVLRLSSSSDLSFDLGSLPSYFTSSGNNLTFYPELNGSINSTMANQPHYLRLAYTSNGSPGDFTKAAIAYWNGTWVDAPEGAT